MPDRADWIAIILLASGFALTGIYVASSIFSNVVILLAAIFVALYVYASYWAFKIRRVLVVKIYRNQALGIGVVALGWILNLFNNIVFNAGIITAYIPFFIINNAILILLFYFIDASVLAGRRSDPLLRDTLHWQKLRILLWILNFAVAAIIDLVVIYFQITTGNEPQFLLVYGGFLIVYLMEPVSLVALAVTAVRSKDKLLHAQVAWFGAFLAAELVIVDISRVANSNVGLVIGLLLGGYCLFRSAKSLVPLNKLEVVSQK
jgi:hypothetical protein